MSSSERQMKGTTITMLVRLIQCWYEYYSVGTTNTMVCVTSIVTGLLY